MKWDSSLYDQKHSFVTRYGEGVLALLAPAAGERILDVGCGTGHLTDLISRSGAIVTGIDNSTEMIATAHAAYPAIEFVVADASEFSFDRPFDAIFSNAALHWVHRAEEAVRCMSRALRPGGRFVVEFGGRGNVRRIYSALEEAIREQTGNLVTAQNYFPSIGEYCPLLERNGLQVASAVLFDRMTRLEDGEDGLSNWIRMFRRDVIENLPEEARAPVLEEVKARTRPALFKDGAWHADYRRLRIVAYKE
ncbi:MAG: class I SAM-dependent methyltransferase [Blastocatellia bacterium]